MSADEFWQDFIISTNRDGAAKYRECFYFDLTEKSANELLALVLSGEKRATASSLFAFECENSKIPKVGDYSIITDCDGIPRCVIETAAVTVLPFEEITFDIAGGV